MTSFTSTVKCSRYPFVQILNWHTSRSAQYDLLCIHCAPCEVMWLHGMNTSRPWLHTEWTKTVLEAFGYRGGGGARLKGLYSSSDIMWRPPWFYHNFDWLKTKQGVRMHPNSTWQPVGHSRGEGGRGRKGDTHSPTPSPPTPPSTILCQACDLNHRWMKMFNILISWKEGCP